MTIRTCAVVGTGLAAKAIVPSLVRAGVTVASVTGRNPGAAATIAAHASLIFGPIEATASDVDAIILAISDSALREVSSRLGDLLARDDSEGSGDVPIVAHLAGALRPSFLVGVTRPGKMHPIASLAGGARLEGVVWGVEGDPKVSVELCELVRSLDGLPIDTSTTNLALYHLAAVIGSNFLVSLMAQATELWRISGAPLPASEALLPLARTVLENWTVLGIENSLTGPIARGDSSAVAAQLKVAAECGKTLESLYRALAMASVNVAESVRPGDPLIAEIARLLQESGVLN